jgi:hypothetical protein
MEFVPISRYNSGYQYPQFPSVSTLQQKALGTPQVQIQNTDTFEAKKQELSIVAKAGFVAVVLTLLAIGADFAFAKGKHVKKILSKKVKNSLPSNSQISPKPTRPNNVTNSTKTQTTKKGVTRPTKLNNTSLAPTQQTQTQGTNKASNTQKVNSAKAINLQSVTDDKILKARKAIASRYGYNADDYSESFYPKVLYSNILNDSYKTIRLTKVPYATRLTCNPNIEKVTEANVSGVKAVWENGWYYRVPVKRSPEPIVDRISLNVYPEDELIQKLDKFVANSGGTVEYKTSECFSSWNERHDPITIYFRRIVNKADEDAIVKIASKHVRHSEEGTMIGRKLADGIYQVKEPDEKDVLALIDKAKKLGLDPKLIECLKSSSVLSGARIYKINSKGQVVVKTSPGAMEAAKRLIYDLAKLSV